MTLLLGGGSRGQGGQDVLEALDGDGVDGETQAELDDGEGRGGLLYTSDAADD